MAAAITFFSVRVSDKPADADHQYGHGKVENFSAFIETGLLLLTCVWIVYEALKRLFFHDAHIYPSVWAFAVMGVSIVVDVWRSRRLRTHRREVRQPGAAGRRPALQHRHMVELGGDPGTGAGDGSATAGRHPWLAKADPIAALVVACIVVLVSWRLARQTIDALLDAAPSGIRSRIIAELYQVDGVLEVDRVRIRRGGSKYFVDVSVAMSRTVTFQKSEQVSTEVARTHSRAACRG